jgi:hypothetical protein
MRAAGEWLLVRALLALYVSPVHRTHQDLSTCEALSVHITQMELGILRLPFFLMYTCFHYYKG